MLYQYNPFLLININILGINKVNKIINIIMSAYYVFVLYIYTGKIFKSLT